jgi:serine/threonine protein kinase
MSFAQGDKIGSYQVLALLGSGGMGDVYRARDTKLQREVAIKALPDAFTQDPDRLARFQREAEVLASLNHPNIGAIHNLEEAADGSRFLILELVEGETLADRIARGPLRVDEVFQVGRQIASAIEAAHIRGIIHRDLKPANVKVTPDGNVKVLDFGLAKTYDSQNASLSQSPTVLSGSIPGMIVGTAAYMSPEQARGEAADSQSDVWALGCLLFEMLTGNRAFHGDTMAEVLASTMKDEPDWTMLPADVPSRLRLVLRRCLEKDRRRRLRNIGDAALDLEEGPAEFTAAPSASFRSGVIVPWAITIIAILVAIAAFTMPGTRDRSSVSETGTIRFAVSSPERFFKRGEPAEFAVSPNGRYLVFTAEGTTRKLWIRSLDSTEARPLSGTDTDNSMLPFWSPDSRYIGFYRGNKLNKLSIADGRTEVICNTGGFPLSTWGPGNTIVFAADGKLYRVSAEGGEPQLISLSEPLKNEYVADPQFLPDGDHVIFHTRRQLTKDVAGTWVLSPKSGQLKRILPFAVLAAFSPPRHLVYIRDGNLYAQMFDPAKLETSGEPILIEKEAGLNAGIGGFSLSENGTLAWSGQPNRAAQVVWRDRSGKSLQVALQSGLYRQIRLSPDASRAVVASTGESGFSNIWLLQMSNGVFSPLINNMANNSDPVWSPDGRDIVFTSLGNLYRNTVDTTTIQPLLESKESKWVHDWSPDGQYLVYAYDKGVYALPMSGNQNPVTLLENDFRKDEFRVSPDSRWIAYNSMESGRSEVYVASFPKFDRRRQVSNSGGAIPRWRKDMREMYYLRLDGTLMAVDLHPGETLETGVPHELFHVDVPVSTVLDQYDVTGDGQRFIVIENEENATSPPINVVVNWTAQLK